MAIAAVLCDGRAIFTRGWDRILLLGGFALHRCFFHDLWDRVQGPEPSALQTERAICPASVLALLRGSVLG